MKKGIGFCLALAMLFMVQVAAYSAESSKPSENQINEFLRAVKAGDIAFVKNALEQDPTLVNIENSHGIAPLMCAIFDEQEEIVKLLVSRGADVNADFGPLGTAAYEGVVSTVEYLISQGAEINGVDYNGRTPIFGAAEGGKLEAARLLIKKGAKINVQNDFFKYTPLSTAVSNGCASVVKLLTDNGADVNLAKENGTSPLHQATSAYIATLLISKGADVNAADENGVTPLHTAAALGRVPVVEVLIKKGADLSAKTKADATIETDFLSPDVHLPASATPREVAEKAGKTEAAKLLAEAEASHVGS